MAIPRRRGSWANGQPIAPGSRIPVDRDTLGFGDTDPTPAFGIQRPILKTTMPVGDTDPTPPHGMQRPILKVKDQGN